MPQLHVGVSGKAGAQVHIGSGIHIGVELAPRVAVVLLQRVYCADIVAHPCHLPEMVASVPVGSPAYGGVDTLARVVYREQASAEIIVVFFQPHEVGLLHKFPASVAERLEAILNESASGLVLVVIAVALGVVERKVHTPAGGELLRAGQVYVVLHEVVELVGIVGRRTVVGSVAPAGVVAPAVFLHFFLGGVVPRHVGLFLAAEREQAHGRAAGGVGKLPHVAPQLRIGSVDVAVGTHMTKTHIHAPMVP